MKSHYFDHDYVEHESGKVLFTVSYLRRHLAVEAVEVAPGVYETRDVEPEGGEYAGPHLLRS